MSDGEGKKQGKTEEGEGGSAGKVSGKRARG